VFLEKVGQTNWLEAGGEIFSKSNAFSMRIQNGAQRFCPEIRRSRSLFGDFWHSEPMLMSYALNCAELQGSKEIVQVKKKDT
jgi:hypothetical protein